MRFTADIGPERARQGVRKDHDGDGECVVLAACDRCDRRASQLHLAGRRVFLCALLSCLCAPRAQVLSGFLAVVLIGCAGSVAAGALKKLSRRQTYRGTFRYISIENNLRADRRGSAGNARSPGTLRAIGTVSRPSAAEGPGARQCQRQGFKRGYQGVRRGRLGNACRDPILAFGVGDASSRVAESCPQRFLPSGGKPARAQ